MAAIDGGNVGNNEIAYVHEVLSSQPNGIVENTP